MANTKDINTIQYAENKTQSEIEYINSKITTCPKWHRINQFHQLIPFTAYLSDKILTRSNITYLSTFSVLSFSSDRQHLSYDVCLEVRGNIIRTVLCCIVYWSCAQS